MTAISVLLSSGGASTFATASVTRYGGLCTGSNFVAGAQSTEATAQVYTGIVGTLSNFYVTLGTNSRASSSTSFKVRKNTANGNLTVTFAASTAGSQTDTTHTDVLAIGDLINNSIATGSGTGSIAVALTGVNFRPLNSTVVAFGRGSSGSTLTGTGPINDYISFAGPGNDGATVTIGNAQALAPIGGTASYFQAKVPTNTRTGDSVFSFNINGSNGAQTFTFATTETALKEDTTNSDTLAVNDLVAIQVALANASTGVLAIDMNAWWYNSATDGKFWCVGQNTVGVAASTTAYMPISGRITSSATELDSKGEVGLAGTAKNLWIKVSTNASTTDAALRFRINGGYGNQNVTITALTTGPFQDTSNSDTFVATDLLCYEMSGQTTGSVTWTAYTMEIDVVVLPMPRGLSIFQAVNRASTY